MTTNQHAVIWSRDHQALIAALRQPVVSVTSRREFLSATSRPGAVAFVDLDKLPELAPEAPYVPIVGVLQNPLVEMVGSLQSYPWLSHLVASSMFATPIARPYLAVVMEELECWPERRVDGVGVGIGGIGRVALVAQSSRRGARIDRMREFFSANGMSDRTIVSLSDAAEELMSNALYDAPVEAGYFKNVVPRTQDVNLPPNCACEISYGIDETNGFLRVRDPFGAFTRARLLGVLARCSGGGVSLDESRGGAGLGLWRVFSIASTVAITVVPGRLTDILVGIVTKDAGKRAPGQRLLAVHLFFNSNTEDALPDEHDVLDDSVAIVA